MMETTWDIGLNKQIQALEKDMKIVNNSHGKAYYTQRNNKLNSSRACNVTAMVNALVSAGWKLPWGEHTQVEDNLMKFIQTNPTIKKEWDKIDPNHNAPPNEWYGLLAMGTNLWLKSLGGPKVELTWLLTPHKYKQVIDGGGAVVFSAKFSTKNSTISHIVAGVGYKAKGANLVAIIIDDPYGDYRNKYVSVIGNDVEMPLTDYIEKVLPYDKGTKLGIIVPKYMKE
jgi:hypothetical protein